MFLYSFAQCSLLSMCSVPGTVLGPRVRAMCLSHFVPYRGPQPSPSYFLPTFKWTVLQWRDWSVVYTWVSIKGTEA